VRTLVLGGARSGKSGWAESLFDAHGPSPVDYVATARPWPGADGFDADFTARIAGHRERRPAHWRTVDDVDAIQALRRPIGLAPSLTPDAKSSAFDDESAAGAGFSAPFVLLDDVGTWLTGVLDRENLWDSSRGSVAPWTDEFVAAVRDWGADEAPVDGVREGVVKQEGGGRGEPEPHLVIVTPEVGMGVIPEHRSGRLFRDEIGLLNGRLAEVCDRVVLVVAGVALHLK